MSSKQLIQNHKKTLKRSLIVLSIVAIYALLLGVLTPYVLKEKLPPIVNENSSYSLQVEEININPFYLSLEIKQLTILDKNEAELTGFSRLFVNFQLSSLFHWVWTFDEFTLEAPHFHYQLYQNNSSNIDELISSQDSTPKNGNTEDDAIAEVLIALLNIEQLNLRFTDHTKKEPFDAHIGPINISLDNFTTQRELNSPYELKATSADGVIGSSLAWQGHVTILPLRSSGSIKIDNISLPTLYQYFKEDLPTDLSSGKLTVYAEYAIDLSQQDMLLNIKNANMAFTDLFIKRKGVEDDDVQLASLAINGLNYSSAGNQVKLKEVVLSDSLINLIRNKDGELNLLQLLPPNSNGESSDESSDKSNDSTQQELHLSIDKITLANNELKIIDNTTAVATRVSLTSINMSLNNFNLQPETRLPLDFSAVVDQSGNISAKGDLTLYPISAKLDLNAETIPLLSIEPYMHQVIISELIDGNVDASLKINYTAATTSQDSAMLSPESLNISGDMTLNNWRSRITDKDEDYIRINKVLVQGLELTQPENTININKITIDKLWLNAERNKQGILNMATIKKERIERRNEAEEKGEGNSAIINLDHFQINSSAVVYTDYSVSPRYKVRIDPIQATIMGLSSKVNSRASIDLQAKINKFAPLKLKGNVNLLSETLYTNFNLLLNDLQMSDFTPFSGTYVGREIKKGKLNLNLSYLIEGQELSAGNTVFIDQFYLGDKVASEQATSLPLDLAVSLLKDSDDEIHIDMPINGNLNDPDFSYGKLVWKALGNLIVKAVTSPFSLLAGLVDSDEDLGSIEFIAGNPSLNAAMIKRLNLLKQALMQRPKLHLEVTGCYHPQDSEALKNIELQQLINKNSVELSSAQRLTLLENVYQQTFAKPYDFGELPIMEPDTLVTWKTDKVEPVLLANIVIDKNLLINLAQERSRNIQHTLLSDDMLTPDRIIIGKVRPLEASLSDISCPLAPAG